MHCNFDLSLINGKWGNCHIAVPCFFGISAQETRIGKRPESTAGKTDFYLSVKLLMKHATIVI